MRIAYLISVVLATSLVLVSFANSNSQSGGYRLTLGIATVKGMVFVRLQNSDPKRVKSGYVFRAGDQVKVGTRSMLTVKYRDGKSQTFRGPTNGWIKLLRHQTSGEKALALELASQLQPAVKPKGDSPTYPASGATVPIYGFFVAISKSLSGMATVQLSSGGRSLCTAKIRFFKGQGMSEKLVEALERSSDGDFTVNVLIGSQTFASSFSRIPKDAEDALRSELDKASKSLKDPEDVPMVRAIVLAKAGYSALARHELQLNGIAIHKPISSSR